MRRFIREAEEARRLEAKLARQVGAQGDGEGCKAEIGRVEADQDARIERRRLERASAETPLSNQDLEQVVRRD